MDLLQWGKAVRSALQWAFARAPLCSQHAAEVVTYVLKPDLAALRGCSDISMLDELTSCSTRDSLPNSNGMQESTFLLRPWFLCQDHEHGVIECQLHVLIGSIKCSHQVLLQLFNGIGLVIWLLLPHLACDAGCIDKFNLQKGDPLSCRLLANLCSLSHALKAYHMPEGAFGLKARHCTLHHRKHCLLWLHTMILTFKDA